MKHRERALDAANGILSSMSWTSKSECDPLVFIANVIEAEMNAVERAVRAEAQQVLCACGNACKVTESSMNPGTYYCPCCGESKPKPTAQSSEGIQESADICWCLGADFPRKKELCSHCRESSQGDKKDG